MPAGTALRQVRWAGRDSIISTLRNTDTVFSQVWPVFWCKARTIAVHTYGCDSDSMLFLCCVSLRPNRRALRKARGNRLGILQIALRSLHDGNR